MPDLLLLFSFCAPLYTMPALLGAVPLLLWLLVPSLPGERRCGSASRHVAWHLTSADVMSLADATLRTWILCGRVHRWDVVPAERH